jgi:hypothetical protein
MKNVIPLTHPGSRSVMLCFANKLDSEEVRRRFGQHFSIEILNKRTESVTDRSIVVYYMTRNTFGLSNFSKE